MHLRLAKHGLYAYFIIPSPIIYQLFNMTSYLWYQLYSKVPRSYLRAVLGRGSLWHHFVPIYNYALPSSHLEGLNLTQNHSIYARLARFSCYILGQANVTHQPPGFRLLTHLVIFLLTSQRICSEPSALLRSGASPRSPRCTRSRARPGATSRRIAPSARTCSARRSPAPRPPCP